MENTHYCHTCKIPVSSNHTIQHEVESELEREFVRSLPTLAHVTMARYKMYSWQKDTHNKFMQSVPDKWKFKLKKKITL